MLASLGQGPRGAPRPGTSSPALCPSPPSAISRVPDPRKPSKPPETVTPGVYGLHQSATHGSQAKGSLDLASHIPKGERRVAALFPLRSSFVWDSLLSQLGRLQCPDRCRTPEEFARTPPLPQTSAFRYATPPICALLLLPLGSLLLNGPGLGIRPSPQPAARRARESSPRLPRVPPPPPGFLSPRSGAPCQAHDVMVYVNQ